MTVVIVRKGHTERVARITVTYKEISLRKLNRERSLETLTDVWGNTGTAASSGHIGGMVTGENRPFQEPVSKQLLQPQIPHGIPGIEIALPC
jgi:hypothetical protein